MRLIPRHRNRNRNRIKAPRIAISQAEITADLHYPSARPARGFATAERAGSR